MVSAAKHHRAGQLSEAEKLYRQVVKAEPGNADALHGLGMIANQSGHPETAVKLIEQAIGVNPEKAEYHVTLGHALQFLDRLDEALGAYQRAAGVNPDLAIVHGGLANVLNKLERHGEAEAAARTAVRIDPALVDAHKDLGVAVQYQERHQEAAGAYQRALDLDPRRADLHNNLGFTLMRQGETAESVASFREAIDLDPRLVPAWYNLGNALRELGHLEEAANAYIETVKLWPLHAEAQINLGTVHQAAGDHEEAQACYAKAIETDPGSALAQTHLGNVLQRMGRYEAAVTAFRKAIDLDPASLDAQGNLALFLEQANRLDEARALVDSGLATAPDDPLLNLVAAKCERREGEGEKAAARLTEVLEKNPETSKRENIYYELGRIHDAAREADRAFGYFSRANELARQRPVRHYFDNNKYAEQLDGLLELITKDWAASCTPAAGGDDDRAAPVFLIGFPRSGTTLLEQILDSHPALVTLEEKPVIVALRNRVAHMTGGYPGALAGLSAKKLQDLRRIYFSLAEKAVDLPPGKLLVDKFPLNTPEVPLIWRIFPDAKFIFAVRHPMDVCLSSFMQEFEINEAMVNFLSLNGTAATYERIMGLWRRYEEVLPITAHRVRYEDVVDDLEGEARRLLDFLGLEWDQAVLDFAAHARNRDRIATPSYHQVTQPIYRDARYRWQRYEAHLQPIKNRLAPFVEYFGYES